MMTEPIHMATVPQQLWGLGARFIRVKAKEKTPVDEWTKPENQFAVDSPELIDWLTKGGNYGVVGGKGLIIIDADDPELKEYCVKSLPTTFMVETGGGGLHLYYKCDLEKPIRLRGRDGDNIGDIQATNKFAVGANSIHPDGETYKVVNRAEVAELSEEKLTEVLAPYIIPPKQFEQVVENARREKDFEKIDIARLIPTRFVKQGDEYYGPHPIHGSANGRNLWINPTLGVWTCFRCGTGGGSWSLLAILEGMIPCQDAVSGALRGDTFRKLKARAIELGYIKAPSKSKPSRRVDEEEEAVTYTPFRELGDGRIIEEGYDGKDVYYLVYDPTTGAVEKKPEVEDTGLTFKPIDSDEVRDGTILLPSVAVEYGSEEQLTEEIRSFLNKWHEPPDTLSRDLDVLYTYLTYIKDLIPQLPYRRYLAPWGRGKSAWLEATGWIGYRGIVLAGSDTDKSVVRKLNNWRGTAIIDEADFGDSTFYAFLIKILNIGYDKKTGYYHRSDEDDPNRTFSYQVYGPKLLATRSRYQDLALESRCLTTTGRQNVEPIPLFRMDNFLKESQALRNKLMMWRFRNYHKVKEKAKELEDKGLAKKVYDGADGISSRVKQVILPLWLIGGDTLKKTLTEMAQTFDRLLKIEDPDYLLELQAQDAVKEIVKQYTEAVDDPDSSVNIRNIMNILYEDSTPYYSIPLNLISRTILTQRGAKEDEITISDMTSTSKNLKGILGTNLGYRIRIGKKRTRIVLIPSTWITQEPKGGLDEYA